MRILAVILALASAPALAQSPLLDLAAQVPRSAAPPVTLMLPEPAADDADPMAPFRLMTPGGHVDFTLLAQGLMGLPVPAILALADWGMPPDTGTALLLRPGTDLAGLEPFLDAGGYQTRDVGGVPVRWLGEDLKLDLTRRGQDAYVGPVGQSRASRCGTAWCWRRMAGRRCRPR